MNPGNWLGQVAAVTEVNLRTIKQRLGTSAVAVVGVAGVVTVFVSVLSMAEGFQATLANTGSPDVAMVMRGGTDTEMNSVLLREDTRIIMDAPGIRRTPEGPLASAELLVLVDLPLRYRGDAPANVPLRGVEPTAFQVREKVRVVRGRRFEPGKNELIAGVAAAHQFRGLEVGATLELGRSDWEVVGHFTSGGSVAESELWGDVNVLQPAYRRNAFQAVYAKLTSPGAFTEFKDTLTADPRLDVKVVRENEYYAEQSRQLHSIITGLGYLVAALMGVGAVFSALNTMYSAVSARTREIATLRALGFRGTPVAVSVLVEALALALVGGVMGAGLAYVLFDGFRTATINWQTFSQVAFAFAVTPGLLAQGLTYSVLMGFVGGLFPAIRAARLPVAAALREL